MDPLFKSIADDLPLFGYTVTTRKADFGVELEVLACEHPSKAHFWVIPVNNGAFFRALFPTGEQASTDEAGFFTVLNDLNSKSVVARHYRLEAGIMGIAAWYPPPYDKGSFGAFFGQYLLDVSLGAEIDPELLKRFFETPVKKDV